MLCVKLICFLLHSWLSCSLVKRASAVVLILFYGSFSPLYVMQQACYPGFISSTHPNVLWRQHYGKAALATWDHKEALCVAVCFTHTHTHSIQRGADNIAVTLTFTLHSLCTDLVIAQTGTERSLYIRVCVWFFRAGLADPFMSACYPCFAKSPLLPFLQEHCPQYYPQVATASSLTASQKRTSVVRKRGLWVVEREGVLCVSAWRGVPYQSEMNFQNSCSMFKKTVGG